MKILNGEKIAQDILEDISEKTKSEKTRMGLAVFLIGDDKASEIYVKLKKAKSEKVGIDFFLFRFEKDADEKKIMEKMEELNKDEKVNGIIVQLPLPKKFNTQKIIDLIKPEKDVDGFHPDNIELFLKGEGKIFPVFPQAIIKIIENSGCELENKKAVVVSNSELFGKIMSEALKRKKIKSEYVLRKEISKNVAKIKEADVLISAVGERGIIKGGMLKEGAIVIDGGIVKENKKVFGDVDFASTKKMKGFVTPVPRGVGPVTVACLLQNVLMAFENQN